MLLACKVSQNEEIEKNIKRKNTKRWWFNTQSKRMMNETYPEQVEFSFWRFTGFCRINKSSWRRANHAAFRAPTQLRNSISRFRANLYNTRNFANIDQMSMLFVLEALDLEKLRCTVQMTSFAGSKDSLTLVIFWG